MTTSRIHKVIVSLYEQTTILEMASLRSESLLQTRLCPEGEHNSDLDTDSLHPISITESKTAGGKKICFLIDSTLTAYLLMNNLSPSLKNNVMTMFEVEQLLEDQMDNFRF